MRWDTLLTVVLLAVGPLVGWYALEGARADEERHVAAEIDTLLGEHAQCLDEQLASILEALDGVRDFFEGSEDVTREEFALFAGRVLRRHAALAHLAYAPRTPRDARDEEDGLRHDETALRAWSEADVLYPVAYLESSDPDGAAAFVAGRDVATGRGFAFDLMLAQRLGRPVLASAGRLPGDAPGAARWVTFLAPMSEDRARGVDGHGGGVIWAAAHGDTLLTEMQSRSRAAAPARTGFEVYERHWERRIHLGFSGGAAMPPRTGEIRSAQRALRTDDQGWTLRMLVPGELAGTRGAWPPWAWGMAATLGWSLFALAVIAAGRSFRRRGLRRQARTVARVMGSLAEGVIVVDGAGRIVTVNAAAARILGSPPAGGDADAWLGRLCEADRDPSASPPPGRPALSCVLAGEVVPEHTCFLPPTDGSGTRWLSVSARPLAGGPRGSDGAVVVVRDITTRHLSQEGMERLSRAIEQTADLVVITDADGNIEYVNPAFSAVTGYAPEEALGSNPRLLKSDVQPPEEFERLWSTILSGRPYRGTIVNRRKDGTTYTAEQTITCVRDPGGRITHFVSVSKDMTERNRLKRQELELELAADVQRRLFPTSSPSATGLDVAGRVAAATETAGDTYDLLPRPHGRLLLSVGDVAGHGMAAALLMSEVRAYVRSLAGLPLSLAEILRRVNALLRADLAEGTFVTLLLVEVDPASGRISWSSAGHVPGLLLGRDGGIIATLGPTGPALGLFGEQSYGLAVGDAPSAGELLLLVTDGATECLGRDGEPLDDAGVAALAAEVVDRPAAEIVEHMQRAFAELAPREGALDDITIVALRGASEPGHRARTPHGRLARS